MPERHRIILLSFCSLLWTTFLAYMKQLDYEKEMALQAQQQREQLLEQQPQSHHNVLHYAMPNSQANVFAEKF